MPVISMFYGIIVMMYFMDDNRHKKPHIHIQYQDFEAVLALPQGDLLQGDFPSNKMKLVQAWMEIHKDELLADWDLAVQGEAVFKIDPLK